MSTSDRLYEYLLTLADKNGFVNEYSQQKAVEAINTSTAQLIRSFDSLEKWELIEVKKGLNGKRRLKEGFYIKRRN